MKIELGAIVCNKKEIKWLDYVVPNAFFAVHRFEKLPEGESGA